MVVTFTAVPLVLDLLRHGQALAPGPQGDAARPLSPAGRRSIERLARRLASEGWRPDRILTSPLLRARETAEILCTGAASGVTIEIADALAPDRDPLEILEALAHGAAIAGHVLLVTHQPLIGQLAAHLTGREHPFRAGSLVRVECPPAPRPGDGRVTLVIHPQAGD
jgi:phosphohistidine phosphatase